jgi:hypothetical protein
MPIIDDDLMAAIAGGAASADPAPAATTPEDNDNADDESPASGADDSADDTTAVGNDGADDDSSSDDSDESGTADDSAEPELGPDGKPVAKAAAKADEPAEIDPATGKPFTPEQVKAKKEKEEFAKQQVDDPVNAPIPKYLKETTQKRMTKLVEIAKDLTTKHQSALTDRNEIIGMITETGATAAQYTGALQYLKMVNSRDPEQIKAAINVMQQELTALSRMSGIPVAGVDLLSNHADLKAAVESKQITQQLAEEIAAGREQRTVQTEQSRAAQQTTEQAQAAHQSGVRALNDIGKQLAARDPNYRTKAAEVLKEIQPEMVKLHPSQWAQTFLVAYTTHKPKPVAPVVRKAPVVPKNQPLRGNNPSGGQQKEAGSLNDAISMGIAAGTRR